MAEGLAPLSESGPLLIRAALVYPRGMGIRERLKVEFAKRVGRNPRYSFRAYARSLSMHHATLKRVLEGSRGLSPASLTAVCAKLGYSTAEVRLARLDEDARKILQLVANPDFRPDCRWIAVKSGVDVDNVNRALHLLIHQRRLVMNTPDQWTVNS